MDGTIQRRPFLVVERVLVGPLEHQQLRYFRLPPHGSNVESVAISVFGLNGCSTLHQVARDVSMPAPNGLVQCIPDPSSCSN